MLLVTTAMKPASDFTTPRKLIFPISRHFLPVEHPEPPCCCTTGLKNGSRFPFMAHFFSSGLGCLVASAALVAAAGLAATEAAGLVSGVAFTCCLGACAAGFRVGAAACATNFWVGAGAAAFGAGADACTAGFGAGAAAFTAAATFGAADAGAMTGLAAAVCGLAAGVGALPGAAAGAFFATDCVCRVSTNLPDAPGVNS